MDGYLREFGVRRIQRCIDGQRSEHDLHCACGGSNFKYGDRDCD